MKRKILLFSLTLVLILTAITPAAAVARDNGANRGNDNWSNDNRGNEKGAFSGAGLIYVTYMPDPVIKKNVWTYKGEIAEGFLEQCDWDLLEGTVFWSEHDSIVRVDDEGNARGMMRGSFTLTRPDGTGTLEGSFSGVITGNLYTGDIKDAGAWQSRGGSGVFENITALGKWSADLHYDAIPGTEIYTLVGPLDWEGSYTSRGAMARVNRPERLEEFLEGLKPNQLDNPWQPGNQGQANGNNNR